MSKSLQVQDTAFVTSVFRSMHEAVSQDTFAKLWKTPEAASIAQDYTNSVSAHEPFAHSLRNRFFYESFSKLIESDKIDCILNFGCGFSMYPYLLPEHIVSIEIDMPNLIEHKDTQTAVLEKNGRLPERHVHRIPVDFNSPYEAHLLEELKPLINGKRTFILIEGVLFFLSRKQTIGLFKFFSKIQTKGDYLGSVSFTPDIEDTRVFKKMLSFSNRKTGKDSDFQHQTIENEFYTSLKEYKLLEHEDFYSLTDKFSKENISEDADKIINEHMYLLQKIS